MYLDLAQILTLFCGISLVYGYSHFKCKDCLFKYVQQSFKKSNLRNDSIQWIEQEVDHFNNTDHRTWRQKYYEVMYFWKPEGPILLILDGEREEPSMLQSKYEHDYVDESQSLLVQIAEETGAAFYTLEHRYYGESQPFDKPTIKELAFLHSRQALADAAHFLRTIKKTPKFQKSKVIVVGCSYAGNLAAWMRLMYPDLVDAVLASSAPVLAKKDFYEYLEAVTNTFRTYGSQQCVDEINERFNTKITVEHDTCDALDSIYTYTNAAQSGTPTRVISICRKVKNCSNIEFKTQELDPQPHDWLWIYQSCTEFGYFHTTTSGKQMFGNYSPLDVYINECKSYFGEEFNEARVDQGVHNTNRMYGGLTPNVTNVVFVNGDMDPWHRLGVVQDLSADAPAIFIKGSSHCHDLDPDLQDDPDSIKNARKRIKTLLKKWIGQA